MVKGNILITGLNNCVFRWKSAFLFAIFLSQIFSLAQKCFDESNVREDNTGKQVLTTIRVFDCQTFVNKRV